jgi:hypothetical protein
MKTRGGAVKPEANGESWGVSSEKADRSVRSVRLRSRAGGMTSLGSDCARGTPPPVFSVRVANTGLMLDATSTLVDRVKRLTADSSQPRALEGRESEELEGSEGGESRGSEDPRLLTHAREPNAPRRSG